MFYGECISNYLENRVLTGHYFASQKMTIEMCISGCQEKGFPFSGLQERKKCFCGEAPAEGFQWAWLDECDDDCAGDSKQTCGGSNAMSLYTRQGVNKAENMIIFNPLSMKFWNLDRASFLDKNSKSSLVVTVET